MSKAKRDLIIHGIFILLGILVLFLIPGQIQKLRIDTVTGPRFFPYFAAGLILVVNASSILKILSSMKKNRAKKTAEDVVEKIKLQDELRVLLILAITLAYIVLMPKLGYLVASLFTANLLLVILNARKWYNFIAVSAFTVLIYLVFVNVFYVSLP